MAPARDPLADYHARRRFEATPEPRGRPSEGGGRIYAIQKHAARRLHYDLRLELDGVLKSWAVTRGPSLDPAEKRLAVRTEDHPLDYATFEGRIPEGNYGAGEVLLWDRGTWTPEGDPHEGLRKGKLTFHLDGERLKGAWALVRMREPGRAKRENWLLVKADDASAERGGDVLADNPGSVVSGRSVGARRPKRTARADRRWRPLPTFREPSLAALVDRIPAGHDWLYEVKFDGYRLEAAIAGDKVRLHTRSGLDWTGRFPSIAAAAARLGLDGALLDGEVIVADKEGRSDFAALQSSMKSGARSGLAYFAFDLLVDEGKDIAKLPLVERKRRLAERLGGAGQEGPIYYTDHLEGPHAGAAMFAELCRRGFEGVIAKRAGQAYRPGRRGDWLKIKCGRRQEFVIIGWSPSSRGRPFASIVLAVNEGRRLVYAGRVGAGFSDAELEDLASRFAALSRRTPPVETVPADIRRRGHWVEPRLVAEVAFAGFTHEGIVRQGRYLGLREDKAPGEVARECEAQVEEVGAVQNAQSDSLAGVRLTHPDKVLFPEMGITKRALADYLAAVADRMLPHLERRLVSLVRCPQGEGGSCFFQRHAGTGLPRGFARQTVAEKDGGSEEYIYITGRRGLVEAAQIGVLEIHIWGSRIDRVEVPDRIVFDLDPDEGLPFSRVREAAAGMRGVLDALGLSSFALVTGGKGVHVVVPVRRRHEWPMVKGFCRAVAERVVEADPERFVATMSKARRKGKIFIDYFRNERTASAIAPYSTRARPGAPIACPVSWDELASLETASVFSLADAAAILQRPDPWADYSRTRQSLTTAAFQALGLNPE